LERAIKLAEQLDWLELVECIREEAASARSRFEQQIGARRGDLLTAAKTAGVPAEMRSRSNRIVIFHVDYEDATAVVIRLLELTAREAGFVTARIQCGMQHKPFAALAETYRAVADAI
jgi:uncharacterized protein YceH (UPF0502 family)